MPGAAGAQQVHAEIMNEQGKFMYFPSINIYWTFPPVSVLALSQSDPYFVLKKPTDKAV